MKLKQTVIRILAVAMVAGLVPIAVAQEKKSAPAKAGAKAVAAPQLTIVEPVRDFGTVPKGDKIDWSFVVKNTGTADLEILSAQPSCGCTVAEFDKLIKPGQTGKISAHVDTTNFSGPISKSVTIQTNDTNAPSAQLTIQAIVKPYVEAFPAGFVRYNMLHGETQTQSVTIYSEEEEPLQITKVEGPGDHVKIDYAKIEKPEELVKAGRAGQNQYRLNITYGGPTAKIGPLAEKVKIETNSKHSPVYLISLSGVVRPGYNVSPSSLNLGEVPAGDGVVKTVMLKSNDLKSPANFKVTKVESSTTGVTAEAVLSDKPGEYEVKVTLAKGAKEGAVDGKIKIYTSDIMQPVYELPVKGSVKGPAKGSSK